jgi:hypothetical protein
MVRTLFDTLDEMRMQSDASPVHALMERGLASLIIPTDDYVEMMRRWDGVADANGVSYGAADRALNEKYPYDTVNPKGHSKAFWNRFSDQVTTEDGKTLRVLKPEVKTALRGHANEFLELLYTNHRLRKQVQHDPEMKKQVGLLVYDVGSAMTSQASHSLLEELESGNLLGEMDKKTALDLMKITMESSIATFQAIMHPGIDVTQRPDNVIIDPQYVYHRQDFALGGSSFTENYAREALKKMEKSINR